MFGCSHKKRIQKFLSCFSIFFDDAEYLVVEPASSEKRMLFRLVSFSHGSKSKVFEPPMNGNSALNLEISNKKCYKQKVK